MIGNETHPPLIRTLHRLRSAFWRRRVVHWLIRAAWLSLLVPTIVMGGYLWFDWQIPVNNWLPLMAVVAILSLAWSLRPIHIDKMARRLDDLLTLRAQLVTAFEVSSTSAVRKADNPVVETLMQNTVDVAVTFRRQVTLFGRGFWLEMHALVAVAAMLGAMLVFDVLSPNIPQATPVGLPLAGQEPQAEDVVPPNPQLQPELVPEDSQTLSEEQLQAALQALADALRDQAVTRSIAEEIDRGELAGAASEVRRLTDRLDGLSEQARRELGDNLQEAADNIGDGIPGLTDPLEQGNQALDAGNLAGASQALERLAEALDDISESNFQDGPPEAGDEPQEGGEPQSDTSEEAAAEEEGGGEGGGTGQGEGEAGESEFGEEEDRLPIDGQPLELESDSEVEDRVLQPAELQSQGGDERTTDSPFSRQPLNASNDDLGPDPLTYPWEKRDIIRDYFSP